jgi:hypothetical protein
MRIVSRTVQGHCPQRPLRFRPARVQLRPGSHFPVHAEPEPVTASWQLAYIADRMTADELGQLEDLGDGQDGPLRRLFITSTANPARIARYQGGAAARRRGRALRPLPWKARPGARPDA